MAGTTRLELATSAVTETTRHGWLPKPRFGTLGNNYWTMKGPRNGLCRRTQKALAACQQELATSAVTATSERDVLLRRLVRIGLHSLAGRNNAISVRLVRNMGL